MLAISASFEYICYGSTEIIIFLIISVGPNLTSKNVSRAEKVNSLIVNIYSTIQ